MDEKHMAIEEGLATLVVILHAYTHRAADLSSVEKTVVEIWPNAEIYRPELPASLFSMANPNRIAAGLLGSIDQKVKDAQGKGQPFQRIILVGHSLGALLARKLYVMACGEVAAAPFEPECKEHGFLGGDTPIPPRSWAIKVSRIVLLAGMNRGWRVSHHISLKRAPLWAIGSGICHVIHMLTRRWPLIFTIRRGAEFITQLRIQWLFMRRRAGTPQAQKVKDTLLWPGDALTVQLLGSRDDMVAPEDNVDLVSGGDFIYLDVPYSGHNDVIRMDAPVFGPGRKELLVLALQGSLDELNCKAVIPSAERFSSPDFRIKRMVFVIHGIRDVGYWTHKIARRVKERDPNHLSEWATETSSYGYFPMLPFLFPWYRRQKVEWLMDQYAEALARYPNAVDSFSYVGHSNGTYLLAKALEIYPCCRFENVVFAGSVVHRNYDWQRFLNAKPPRVKAVLNFVASADWVVAFFPKLFQFLRWSDLGSAGHDGFLVKQSAPQFYQVEYVKGGHSAAIQELVWDVIANFIVTGRAQVDEVPGRVRPRVHCVELFGRFPVVVWAIIAFFVWGIWWGIKFLLCAVIADPTFLAFATGFAMASYLLVLWLVVTRV